MNLKNKGIILGMSMLLILVGCGTTPASTSTGSNSGTGTSIDPNSTYIDSDGTIRNNQYIKDTYKVKDTYNTLLGLNLKYLNTAVTMSAEDCDHIANFVDGLVENDQYGRLTKALAEKVEVNTIHDEYKFTIKQNIPWVTNKGEQYVATVQGQRVPQVVSADDFVTAAKLVLDFRNASDSYYLPAMFIKGGYEYWAFTYAIYLRDNNSAADVGLTDALLKTDAGLAVATNMIASMVANVQLNVTAADIPAISRFERVGIKATTENGKSVLTYKLENPSYFFLSVLTYTPFLPINAAFINEVGFSSFGESNSKFLYCGPYLLKKWDELSLQYVKNQHYWDKNAVHLETINYSVLKGDIPFDYIRKEFEAGRIDAFGVSQNDEAGWTKYIVGPDGTGTIDNPANDLTYSREIEVVDSTFVFELNVNRNASNADSMVSKYTNLTNPSLVNTDRALKINEVRELVLNGIDFGVYNRRYGTTEQIQAQYQMWTYVPKGFVQNDDNGKDYIEYVYDAYADKFNMTFDEAKAELKQGQIDTRNTKDEIAALATKAKNAITLVNNNGGVEGVDSKGELTAKAQITYPIQVEYLGLNWDAEQSGYDAAWIEEFNQDVNACTLNQNKVTAKLPLCSGGKYPYFEIVNNTKVTEATYINMGESGQYHLYVSGWGADYADPLTFMNTFVTGGDMSMYTGTKKEVIDYRIVDGAVEKGKILEKYDELVAKGRVIYDNTDNRFTYFGQAEVELIFGAHIMKPIYMMGQGWTFSVSKAAGYETPTAAYGLSSYKLKGVYVLTEPMKSADRFEAKALYNENKKAALAAGYNIYA